MVLLSDYIGDFIIGFNTSLSSPLKKSTAISSIAAQPVLNLNILNIMYVHFMRIHFFGVLVFIDYNSNK